jgi:hypothetical protein
MSDVNHEAVARALWVLLGEITMCAYPAGFICVRFSSKLGTDCEIAFGKPMCPQCKISAWLLEHGEMLRHAQQVLRP